jgi:hypothetical protein
MASKNPRKPAAVKKLIEKHTVQHENKTAKRRVTSIALFLGFRKKKGGGGK